MRWEIQGYRASHIWVDTDRFLAAWVFNAETGQWEEELLDARVDDTDTTVMQQSEGESITTLAHELLHTLGFPSHVDPTRFMNESIMNVEDVQVRGQSDDGSVTLYEGISVTGHILFPVDREALLAAYGRLEPGLLPEEFSLQSLDPWSDESFHLLGEMDFPGGSASFAWR